MEDQYGGMGDLRQYIGIGSRALFHPPPQELNPYDMLIFRSDSTASVTTNAGGASSSAAALGGFENGGEGGTGRWPRQETLTLLEIRSRLDPKFKEANQKGPLWDEVSRIMSEEHGYQRSGKKCREKFENLYKYYKKTKEGKAGRQDGKHYRFFRQLEALYGDSNNNNNLSSETNNHTSFYPNFKNQDTSLSLSNYSDADTSSSENSDGMQNKKTSGKTEWKLKMKEFIDSQMKKVMEKQEAWMEKMMRTIEQKEHERMLREEEWRKQDAARVEREHKFWASERAWIEARDAALMEALNKLTSDHQSMTNTVDVWPECEVNRLVQVRAGMEERFQTRGGVSEEAVWEEVSTRMACFGHERSGISCKEKWDSLNNYLLKCNKKRMKSCYYQGHDSISNQGGVLYADQGPIRLNDSVNGNGNDNSSSSGNAGTIGMTDSCFRYFMGDGYGRITD